MILKKNIYFFYQSKVIIWINSNQPENPGSQSICEYLTTRDETRSDKSLKKQEKGTTDHLSNYLAMQ